MERKAVGTKIPAFTKDGFLPEGIHQCNGEEFWARFCEGDKIRSAYTKAITDVFDVAKKRNASYVFGGSFITDVEKPSDFDVVIVFKRKEHIPSKGERVLIEGKKADIMFCSEDDPNIVDAFIHLFSSGRYEQHLGIVQVNISGDNSEWKIRHMPSDDELEIIKRLWLGILRRQEGWTCQEWNSSKRSVGKMDAFKKMVRFW